MWIAYTRPGSEGVYICHAASRENLARTLCDWRTFERTREIPETYYEDAVVRKPEYIEKADGTVEVRMRDTVERVRRIRTKQVTETVTESVELSVESYVKHVFERSIPADALDVTVLPPDFEVPSREDREFWRLRKGKIVVEKPGA